MTHSENQDLQKLTKETEGKIAEVLVALVTGDPEVAGNAAKEVAANIQSLITSRILMYHDKLVKDFGLEKVPSAVAGGWLSNKSTISLATVLCSAFF